MKERLYQTINKYIILLLVGIAYFVFVFVTRIGIPCIFHVLTGLKCPACGVTRMIMALARFDFAAAFAWNPFLLITGPIILFCLITSEVIYIKTGARSLGKLNIVLWGEIAFALVFGVLRNVIPL